MNACRLYLEAASPKNRIIGRSCRIFKMMGTALTKFKILTAGQCRSKSLAQPNLCHNSVAQSSTDVG